MKPHAANHENDESKSNIVRTAERRKKLEIQFEKKAPQFKLMWKEYLRLAKRKNKKVEAQEQKLLVFKEFTTFLIKMYDEDLLVYIEDYGRDRENFTSELFVWFALTLGLKGKEEITEMGEEVTKLFMQERPTEPVQPYGVGLYSQGITYLN